MKNAKFYADFESVSRRKQLIKYVTEIWSFSLLIMFVKFVCLQLFMCAFFGNFFNGCEISKKSAFLIPYLDIKNVRSY